MSSAVILRHCFAACYEGNFKIVESIAKSYNYNLPYEYLECLRIGCIRRSIQDPNITPTTLYNQIIDILVCSLQNSVDYNEIQQIIKHA